MSLIDVTYAHSHDANSLDANSATDTFCSTLMSCFDTFCPLSSRPVRTTPSAVLRKHRSKLRAAERVWRKSQNPTDINFYQSLLSDFSANVSNAKRTYYHDKINNSPNSRMLFKRFPPSFVLLLPLLHQL